MFVISFYVLISRVRYSTSEIFYYHYEHQYQSIIFFKVVCHANLGAERKTAGSSSYISMHLFQKFSNMLASNNASLSTYKSSYSFKFFYFKDSPGSFRVLAIRSVKSRQSRQ